MRKLCLILVCASALLSAQSAPGRYEQSSAASTVRPALAAANAAEMAATPAVRLAELSDSERLPRQRGLALHLGVARFVSGVSAAQLDWSPTSVGLAGRLAVESPGAYSLRLHISSFDGAGGELILRGLDGTVAAGPYADLGPNGDGSFWTELVAGERVVLEWTGPDGAQPSFAVDRVSHQWLDAVSPEVVPPGEECLQNVACYSEYLTQAKAIANLIFVGDDGGSYLCSGALINTKRSTYAPLFLTANHCISSADEAASVVTFWNYQKASCEAAVPSMATSPQIAGARLLSAHDTTAGDFALLKLPKAPTDAYYLGWSATDPATGSKVVGIHHPGVPPYNYKRITFGQIDTPKNDIFYIGDSMIPEAFFHQVHETVGRTEQGSSGSPLLNSNHEIVGVLTFGLVPLTGTGYCLIDGQAGYGKFSQIYPRIREFLEEVAAPKVTLTAPALNFQVQDGVAAAPSRQMVTVRTDSKDPRTLVVRSSVPWLAFDAPPVSVSASTPATFAVYVVPHAQTATGRYQGTLTITLGGVTEASLPVTPATVNATLQVSNRTPLVTGNVNPDPVVELEATRDGHNFEFTLELAESAGLEARITYLSIDGVNYSNRIVELLHANRIAGGGKLSAPFAAHLQPSSEIRTIELRGYAPATGAQWSTRVLARWLPRP